MGFSNQYHGLRKTMGLVGSNLNKTLCFFFCLIFSNGLLAVGEPLFFKSLSKEQGLSQSSVIDMVQTSDGYLWLATQDGLNRFDGYESRVFTHDRLNPDSISDNFIWSLAEDNQGNLWVGTASGGMSRYNPKTEKFTHYRHDPSNKASLSGNQILDILVDSKGQVWAATAEAGINLYNPKTDSFIRFQNFGNQIKTLNSNTVRIIKEAPNGKLWLGYSYTPFLRFPGAGLSLFDPKTLENIPYTTEHGLNDNNVTDILTDSGEYIWISTYRGGLHRLNLKTNQIEHVPIKNANNKLRFNSLTKSGENTLWIAQIGGGLIELNTDSLESFVHRPIKNNTIGLNDLSVSSVLVSNDTLYVGTWEQGLNYTSLKARQFGKLLAEFNQANGLSETAVSSVHFSDFDQSFWIANNSSLLKYDNQFSMLARYTPSEIFGPNSKSRIRFIFTDQQGSVWIYGDQNGLFRNALSDNTASSGKKVSFDTLEVYPQIVAMAQVSASAFLIGTRNQGLWLFDEQLDELTLLFGGSIDKEKASSLSITEQGIIKDPVLNGWWIASLNKGLLYISSQLTLYDLSALNKQLNTSSIQSILPDNNQTLWLGTQNLGVLKLEWAQSRTMSELPSVKSFGQNEGLSTNAIGYIGKSKEDIWISTTQGVSVLNATSEKILNLSPVDGVLSDYSVGLGAASSSILVFSGFQGVTFFNPNEVVLEQTNRKPLINQLLINNQNALIDADHKKTPLNHSSIQFTEELVFHHNLTHFTLGFALLDFLEPRYTQFAYRLHGFDQQWLYTNSNRRFATYTNLDPGHYEFELKASDHLNRWNDNSTKLTIIVEPPPWKTWWAYSLYIFITCLILSSFAWQRIREVRAIKEKNEQLSVTSKLFENTSEGVLLFDFNNKIASVNKGYLAMTGFSENEMMGKYFSLPQTDEPTSTNFAQILDSVEHGTKWQGELYASRKSGEVFPVEIVIDKIQENNLTSNQNQGKFHFVAILSDITERKQHEKKLKELAFFDELTMLPNRSNFERLVENEIQLSTEEKFKSFALMFMDLDNFKAINDSLGHGVGDRFLQKMSQNLRMHLDHEITLARLGGDEFLILLPTNYVAKYCIQPNRASADFIKNIAIQICDLVNHSIDIDEYKLRATCCIGIASFPQHGLSFERLFRNADTAMYEAKKNKYKRVQWYNKKMNLKARQDFEIAEEIREDIKTNKFIPFYQLKINTETGLVDSLEVLARWYNQKLGWISPVQFIHIAEERGLINLLSEQIIRRACQEIKPLIAQDLFTGKMAVNLSPLQFQQADMVDNILAILTSESFPTSHFEVEVTESVSMYDNDAAISYMQAMHNQGISIALDDFGTGFSSLSYLHDFPLDTVKIDRSFIENVTRDKDKKKVVAAIISMSHSLGMKVTAEGIEEIEQFNFLKDLKCDFLQGFLLHEPCDINLLKEVLGNKSVFIPK